jgi:hypothetical protein
MSSAIADIVSGKQIPYSRLAGQLFSEEFETEQKFIPFLGAGVSISDRKFTGIRSLKPPPPDRPEIDAALACLRLKGKGKTFLELAILLAYLIELEDTNTLETADDVKRRLKEETYPPSAAELSQLFGTSSQYSSFAHIVRALRRLFPEQLMTANEEEQIATLQLLAKVTRIANPPEPLTSITSYFEKLLGRRDMWDLLREIFQTKTVPTQTHRLLAEAAKDHLDKPGARDYLIITTNYDCLMESALDTLAVPYVVLTTKRGSVPTVLLRCSKNVRDRDALRKRYWNTRNPSNFTMIKSESVVIIYKIHGCLSSEFDYDDEGVVISDNDYVDYVSHMGKQEGVIPAHVSELMLEKPFWFLGYSLSDWNVRSIYETIKSKSNPDGKEIKDYSVMYSVGDFESLFFRKNNITIFQAALREFVEGIVANLPERIRSSPYPK